MITLGIPLETRPGEARVAITPEIVKKFVAQGLVVRIEAGAGVRAGYPDHDYAQAGANLTNRAEAWAVDLLMKVRRPTDEEVAVVPAGAVYLGLIESCGADHLLKNFWEKKIQVLALERIPRISRAQVMDVLSSQANLAGYRAVIEAAARYGRFFPMLMTAAGSAKPARVVVLGAGVAGLQAIATARRLGADVYAYDVRPETQEQIRSLGAKPILLNLAENGAGAGGYARELSAETQQQQQIALSQELIKAHVIITTALIPCRPAPTLITVEVVQRLRPGSVIIDLAAASGGNCPLTVADQVVEHNGVIIVGFTNYPALVPTDASAFFARNLAKLIEIMIRPGSTGPELIDFHSDEITAAMLLQPTVA